MSFREPRHPSNSSIIVAARGLGRHFTIANVSRSGAGLTGKKTLQIGERVTLNLPRTKVNATVRWAGDGHVGVAFDREIDDGLIRDLVQKLARDVENMY